jgi:hypothetical protein
MSTATISRIDELEDKDRRFQRHPNGKLKSNFTSNGAQGADWVRSYDKYLDQMRKDAADWRRTDDLPAAERAENQVTWESAERESTHASRSRDRSSAPADQERFQERMLEADRDAELAEQRQFASDREHDSQWHESRERQLQEHQAAERQAQSQRQAEEDAKKPLRERLQGREFDEYNSHRENFNRAMTASQGGKGRYIDEPGRSEDFDQRYEQLLKQRDEAKGPSEGETQKKGQKRAGEAGHTAEDDPAQLHFVGQSPAERAPKQAGQDEPTEAQAADGKKHSPLLKQHGGYRAQVAEDQKSISYFKDKSTDPSFIDRGDRVSLAGDVHKRDPEALQAALRHADEKFERFHVRGTREQQESSARLAERMGLGGKVANEDLQDILRQEREQIAHEKAEQAQRDQVAQKQGEQGHKGQQVEVDGATQPREAHSQQQAESDSNQQDARDSAPRESQQTPDSAKAEKADAASASTPAAPTEGQRTELAKPPDYDELTAAQARGEKLDSSEKKLTPPPDADSAQQKERPPTQKAK